MSRFDRTSTSTSNGSDRKATAVTPTATLQDNGVVTTGSVKDLSALQDRLTKIQERRIRREVDLENARRELNECQKSAQALGVSSLEELEAKVAQLREEDERAMQEFLQALIQEEELLDSIDRQLSALERQ